MFCDVKSGGDHVQRPWRVLNSRLGSGDLNYSAIYLARGRAPADWRKLKRGLLQAQPGGTACLGLSARQLLCVLCATQI
jgi:hypothetical protein